jgi:hypothetical protein
VNSLPDTSSHYGGESTTEAESERVNQPLLPVRKGNPCYNSYSGVKLTRVHSAIKPKKAVPKPPSRSKAQDQDDEADSFSKFVSDYIPTTESPRIPQRAEQVPADMSSSAQRSLISKMAVRESSIPLCCLYNSTINKLKRFKPSEPLQFR